MHAIHHGHADVENDDFVVRPLLTLDNVHCFQAVFRRVHAIKVLLEALLEGFEQERVVVGQQAEVLVVLPVVFVVVLDFIFDC